MVFIIQNTQNRDNLAINLKLEALMLELKVTNSTLYGAENEGEKNLRRHTEALRVKAEEGRDNDPEKDVDKELIS